ncbi:DUF4153 domain-containing protein [Sphingomonas sanxanigenens]|uniref:DUF4153 domain-containing protein n=1 Tax=Sphingomonas sanxanigenens DSM 19645 = NX02 TaxID=1123269 RepID=W0AGX0_9SPHN|nr:DUF4153 domain-containing protein [Sphingomonas sanxanigenens]AHE55792.1 hypothetical protein NX02_20755 [Sphingomonas sanxanigenens DSM 19645 = NX02]
MHDRDQREGWPIRPWVAAAFGALAGFLIWALMDGLPRSPDGMALRVAAAAAIAASTAAFALCYEPLRARWALIFIAMVGLVVGLVLYWNGPTDKWGDLETWRGVCVALSVAIAAPLFQAARDQGARRFPYVEVHAHAWTNVVIWCAAWLFAGIVFILAFLLAALFDLIGIDLLKEALQKQWFWSTLLGTALGGGAGLLRERDRIVGLLERVVVSVLAVLAPVLAVGLVLFLLSLPFTGLTPLWAATRSTTPILLGCVIGALVLANAVIGHGEDQESRFPPLRWAAIALAVVLLPFALIAAVSTGARIGQYGFTPERLWALTFVTVAVVYGVAYLVAVVRGRERWAGFARPSNLHLAFGLCGLALFLATPLAAFNLLATRDQVARLKAGRVTPAAFSWSALAFDFGEPGRAALRELAKAPNPPAIRERAAKALKSEYRADIAADEQDQANRAMLRKHLRILPAPVPLPEGLLDAFGRVYGVDDRDVFVLLYRPGEDRAVLIRSQCETCQPNAEAVVRRADGTWVQPGNVTPTQSQDSPAATREALRTGTPEQIEVREVKRRQVFVNGKPVGDLLAE